jgi:FAD:protein FMN transferase
LRIISRWERRFPAMGTDCHVVVEGGRIGLLDQAEERIADLEARWSRFIPGSELSLLSTDKFGRVSQDSFRLITTGLVGWRLSDGAFDPFLGEAIVAAGYDRDYASLQPAHSPATRLAAGRPHPGFRPTAAPVRQLQRRSGMVRLSPAAVIDSGGIGKGLAADLVSAELIAAGAQACLVNLGGDLRVRGTRQEPWQIAVADELARDRDALTIKLTAGGLATSSVTRRRWVTGSGEPAHHLLDPRTGRSTSGCAAAATAIAPFGWLAEVLSKCALLLPGPRAARLAGRHNGAAVTQDWDGSVTQLG